MKRLIAVFLCLALVLTSCASKSSDSKSPNGGADVTTEITAEMTSAEEAFEQTEYDDISDPEFLAYYEDVLYDEIVTSLDSENYFVEDVEAIFISKEYVDELQYNSMSNVYFGYTLDEIQEQFTGSKYVFALGDDGQTTVKEFEKYEEDNFEQVIKNVVVGTGVILVCVTVSVVAGAGGATAVSVIFAVSAKTGTAAALSDAVISGVSAGIIKGYETGDFNEAMEAAMLSASEGYKWGAITGCATGGAVETFTLIKGAKYLSLNEVALIQKESGYPANVIKQFHNMEEYKVFKDANLKTAMICDKTALIRDDIDLDYIAPSANGKTNKELMLNGNAPFDSTGKRYELHHIGQENDSTLAILTSTEHHNASLHGYKKSSEIDRESFEKTRKEFWKAMANYYN